MSHFTEDECQGCHRNREEPKTYCMTMKLCDNCAQAKKKFIRELSREQKIVFNCHKHPKLRALAFCEVHEETICMECQSSHIRLGCTLIDLKAEIAERRSQLLNLVERCKSKAEELKEFNVNVDIRSKKIEKHFALINDEIRTLASEERLEVENNRIREAEDINRHADDEVERIRREQRESIMKNDREARKKLVKANEKEKGLVDKLAQYKSMFDEKISGMKSHHLLQSLDSVETAESFDDESMLQPEFQRIVASLTSVLNRQVDLKGVDELVRLTEDVSLLHEYDGGERIDVPAERWEEQSGLSWNTGLGSESYMMSAVNEDQVTLKNKDGSVHILDIRNGDTSVVISGKTPYDIYSCAALHDGRVVCGTRFGEVVVYDRAWHPLRVIHLDKLGKSVNIKTVSLCTDANDLVLASNGEPTIHVFNPNNGEFIRSIDIKVRSICELHRLSSADIALRIIPIGADMDKECTDVRILDKNGYLRSKHHLHNKDVMGMAVNESRDRIFMLLFDRDEEEFDMVVLSPSGLADVDIELPFDLRHAEICFMPKMGTMIIHYDGTVACFEKKKPGIEEMIGASDIDKI